MQNENANTYFRQKVRSELYLCRQRMSAVARRVRGHMCNETRRFVSRQEINVRIFQTCMLACAEKEPSEEMRTGSLYRLRHRGLRFEIIVEIAFSLKTQKHNKRLEICCREITEWIWKASTARR
jgi:hypothetical protein